MILYQATHKNNLIKDHNQRKKEKKHKKSKKLSLRGLHAIFISVFNT
jgi:hypothetical protein